MNLNVYTFKLATPPGDVIEEVPVAAPNIRLALGTMENNLEKEEVVEDVTLTNRDIPEVSVPYPTLIWTPDDGVIRQSRGGTYFDRGIEETEEPIVNI